MSDEHKTVAEVFAKIQRFWAKDRTVRLQNTRYPHDQKDIREEEGILLENQRHIQEFVAFLSACTVKVDKPKVLRAKSGQAKHAFHHKHRWVMPQVALVLGKKRILIENVTDVDDTHETYQGSKKVREPEFPHLYFHWGRIHFYRSGNVPNLYDGFMGELVSAFKHEIGDNWQRIVDATRTEWSRVGTNLDELVDAQFGKKGEAERAEFRAKLSKFLLSSKGLIDTPPEAILAFFKLGYDEIEKFARFTTQNRADISLVELDDITSTQQLAQVRKVMES